MSSIELGYEVVHHLTKLFNKNHLGLHDRNILMLKKIHLGK